MHVNLITIAPITLSSIWWYQTGILNHFESRNIYSSGLCLFKVCKDISTLNIKNFKASTQPWFNVVYTKFKFSTRLFGCLYGMTYWTKSGLLLKSRHLKLRLQESEKTCEMNQCVYLTEYDMCRPYTLSKWNLIRNMYNEMDINKC